MKFKMPHGLKICAAGNAASFIVASLAYGCGYGNIHSGFYKNLRLLLALLNHFLTVSAKRWSAQPKRRPA
ncbi:hypothetical protein [Eisenbergiella massiliensis]|uniref:hypothetical protein n=1 Tax=Eisenbergiella massiliensis TaxID=1720294 RepID=UPI000C846576|nr:hypothetical protein [Eisenbergiella massiliensis]